jgi:AcrR family transcriptional regulator
LPPFALSKALESPLPRTSRAATSNSNDSAPVPTGPYDKGGGLDRRAAFRPAATTPATQQHERIQHIAAKLFADRGFKAVGVAEIGTLLGSDAALYYYIKSKEELLFNIVIRYIEDLVIFGQAALHSETDPRERIRLLSHYLMRVIAQNLAEMTVCFREADALTGQRHSIISDLHQQYQDIWCKTFKDGENQGYFKTLPLVAIKGIFGMYFIAFFGSSQTESILPMKLLRFSPIWF